MSSPCYGSFCLGRLGGSGTGSTLLMGTILYKALPEITADLDLSICKNKEKLRVGDHHDHHA